MHVAQFLHKQLTVGQPHIHKKRLSSLINAVVGLLSGEVLQLTAIGRASTNTCTDKDAIKRVDRLLGNGELQRERIGLYQWQARSIIGGKKHPVILLDYSDVNAARTHFILRASVALEGRSLVVYEEVHDRENYAPYWRAYLQTLHDLLPNDCQPIIVSDAGFRGPWRKALAAMGWYFVIRQRNRDLIRLNDEKKWHSCKDLYRFASTEPKYLGELEINLTEPERINACLIHHKPKQRKKKTSSGVVDRSKRSNKNAMREREPWLLLTNLAKSNNIAKNVVAIYTSRMQIEESFRDLKSHRYGFSFRGNRCENGNRLQILLLIAALAHFMTWLMGLYAERNNLHRKMQANTETARRVLSVCTIGLNVFRKRWSVTFNEWFQSMKQLTMMLLTCY